VTPESRGRAGRLDLVDRHHQGTHRPEQPVEVERGRRRRTDRRRTVADQEEPDGEDRGQADALGAVLVTQEAAQ